MESTWTKKTFVSYYSTITIDIQNLKVNWITKTKWKSTSYFQVKLITFCVCKLIQTKQFTKRTERKGLFVLLEQFSFFWLFYTKNVFSLCMLIADNWNLNSKTKQNKHDPIVSGLNWVIEILLLLLFYWRENIEKIIFWKWKKRHLYV